MQKIKRTLLCFWCCFFLLSLPVLTYASPLDWYRSQDSQNEGSGENTDEVYLQYVDGYYDAEQQAKLVLHEQKIISPAFNTVVGRTMIPDGWDMQVMDLSLTSESISCPMAVLVDVTSPDNSCELVFLSRREFKQIYTNLMGYEYQSEDDFYDYSDMYHMLDYRDASACCDLMVNLLFQDDYSVKVENLLTEDDAIAITQAKTEYEQYLNSMFSDIQNVGLDIGTCTGYDATAAKRLYLGSSDEVIMHVASCGFELYKEDYQLVSDTILWSMPYVFAIRADDVSQYQELFDVFCNATAVSDEYETMRSLTASRLIAEFLQAREGSSTFTFDDNGSYSDIESDTIESGDTYSAFEAWDDYIKDETDYTTGDGSHIKLSSSYDHVFEGEDGTIYAGSSVDGPYGSTELNPSQIGE